MTEITGIHHIALIVSNHEKSLAFYVDVLGFKIKESHYREDRKSHKTDLSLNGKYTLELFTFPDSPARMSFPEAIGLRHLAFSVKDVQAYRNYLLKNDISCETIRTDEYTGRTFFFAFDPDQLPLEFYQS